MRKELTNTIKKDGEKSGALACCPAMRVAFRIVPSRAKIILAKVEEAPATRRDDGRALGITAAKLESFSDAFEHDERQAEQDAMP